MDKFFLKECQFLLLYYLVSLLELASPIRVQFSISAPPLDKCPPSDQLDFDQISQLMQWKVRTSFKSTTLIKMFTLFIKVFYQIHLLFVYKGQTREQAFFVFAMSGTSSFTCTYNFVALIYSKNPLLRNHRLFFCVIRILL